MAEGETPNRESVLESITVVFAHSKLKDVVGTDALKSVLSGQYRDLVTDGELNLQVVWDLLEDQPGFDSAKALAPFCLLKTWEKDLNIKVLVPKALADRTATEMLAEASHCPVPKALKRKAVNPEGAREQARATIEALDDGPPVKQSAGESTRKPALEAALGLVAILGLAYGGYSFYGTMAGAQFKTVQTTDLGSDLPIKEAKQLGQELGVLIEDSAWYALPEKARKASLATTLQGLKSRNITSMIVKDASGSLRASVQWVGDPPAVVVRLN